MTNNSTQQRNTDYDNFKKWFDINYPVSGIDPNWLYSLLVRYHREVKISVEPKTTEPKFLQCDHMNVDITAKANNGNYCPQDDYYWYEFRCLDCGAYWTEEQSQYLDRQRKEWYAWEKTRNIVRKS